MHAPRPNVNIRPATCEDLADIIALFASDTVGGHGDTTDGDAFPDYLAAFEHILATPTETLYVAILDDAVVGTFQTTMLRTLVGRGSSSMMIEAVQTREDMCGRGIGEAMMRFAVGEAQRLGLSKVQLTSNGKRKDAHRFYERVGFEPSHLGFKIRLK
ncbi:MULTISPECIES: GNAT family N-acetyltransferase [unclassified Rhizobium]|uniref:GNAT family N-acetyltransferase n=1 Tax=unclassified Rhizobium TaxID=2613769 RepID=UPI0007129B71|nr:MULTISPECIES: GNAT family N-acetyltransferase [unclassified Rhizobium]KQS93930.1 acetyltransferase [Rhizobium sp. Leaf386]KQT06745.1 acetyltransferase [Rhizobium sp. Leaf391]KQU05117.1 acetyltransferase [Rhizobium sp. Leaf453]